MKTLDWKRVECESRVDPCDRHHQAWAEGTKAVVQLGGGFEEGDQLGWLIEITIFHSTPENPRLRFPVASSKFIRDFAGALKDAQREAAFSYWQLVEVMNWGSV